MKFSRRHFLHLAAGTAALPTMPHIARAQAYPSRPVRIIVAYGPGGAHDFHARLIAQWLTERLGKPFLVDNRGGAGGNIGTEAAVRAPADGYTLLLLGSANTVSTLFSEKLTFDVRRDLSPVAGIVTNMFVVVVHPSVPVANIPELISYAKANPNILSFASPGIGSSGHLIGEMFKTMTGATLVHVPYRSEGPAITDLLSGQIKLMFQSVTTALQYVRAGTVRPLGVTATTRSLALPDLPMVGDFVPGFEATSYIGISAPIGTPAEIIDQLNREINAGLASPAINARYAELGATV